MDSITPNLNLPTRKTKKLVKHGDANLGGVSVGWYMTRQVVGEATPMYITTEKDVVAKCVAGQSHGAKTFGLTLQETYEDSVLGQLSGYNFANDTRIPISTASGVKNRPITILTGKGYASTTNYAGAVAIGDNAYIGADGKLAATGAEGDKLPIVFEGAGEDGDTMVRIRFDFPFNAN